MIDTIIYIAFCRHSDNHHNSDYEVCNNLLCWFAYKLERIFRRYYAEWD
jgi:hypothetical protein